ncbi:MAG: hypothetical protein JWN76_1244 [Chitinophagaceae bacterium]|nr:hypothetical protein [Chitinophagaceae bacterium]
MKKFGTVALLIAALVGGAIVWFAKDKIGSLLSKVTGGK